MEHNTTQHNTTQHNRTLTVSPRLRLGIIGNMGPEADEFFQKRIREEMTGRGAQKDQDHIDMVVIKNPAIPDRTAAILEGGQDPVSEMMKSAADLEALGVPFAVMPCNTAHYFRERLQAETQVLIVDMLQATADKIKQTSPHAKVALLATNGTIQSGIYDTYLQKADISFVKPNQADQDDNVHGAIYGTKADSGRLSDGLKAGEYPKNVTRLSSAIKNLQQEHSVDTVILGCTELPLVQKQLEAAFPNLSFLDPMACIAERIVDIYNGVKEKKEACSNNLLENPQDVKTQEQAIEYIYALLHKK